MKNNLIAVALLTLLATLNPQLSTVLAQGTAFTYQGRLNDGAGPATGSYDLTFALYDAVSGPNQVGSTLTNAATPVSNGLFTVTLDFGNQFPGADRWLEIGVRPNGGGAFTTLAPRQPLTATPYAVTAGNLTGTIAPANIAPGTITSAMLANGAVGSTQLASGVLAAPTRVSGTNFSAAPNTSYVITNSSPTSIFLPTNANVGDVIQITGQGAGGWSALGSGGGGWVQSSAPGAAWDSVASSADGRYLVAAVYGGAIYNSTNFGATWTPTSAPGAAWNAVASSADGSHLAAVTWGGGIYSSTNFGATWTLTSAPVDNWRSVASSADGSRLVAGATSSSLYISTNFGATWTPYSPNGTTQIWVGLASAADGSRLVAVTDDGYVFTSSNFGVNWTVQPFLPGIGNWNAVASSADGSRLIAGASSRLYTSTNYGVNWTSNSVPDANWYSVASSSDGSRLAAVTAIGGLYTSTDSGATWTLQTAVPTNASWQAVASSSDGRRLTAAVNGGGIYVSSGFTSGAAGTSASFQYLGNGQWGAISLAPSSLPTNVVFNAATGVTLSGAFSGGGSGLTGLNASQLISGTVADARLSANVSLLGGTIESAEIADGTIVNADVSPSAAIAHSKLANTTPGQVLLGNASGVITGTPISGDATLNSSGAFTVANNAITSAKIADGALVNADVSAAAGIAYSKLALAGSILNADISPSAAIADTKLATISTAGKVANAATTATSANTANTIVARDAAGNFSAGTVTASFSGSGAALTALNASQLTSGTVADGRLSANVALRAGGNTFSGNQTLTVGSLYLDNSQTVQAKNSGGVYETFLWPRWSDNVSYLNYGAGGFNIRNNSSVTTMFMTSGGNVGIGNTTPETTLQVGSYGSADQYLTVATAGGNAWRSGIRLRHFDGGYGWTLVGDERDSSFRLLSHFADTNGATRLFVDRFSGNVGIGTAGPANRLSVNGNADIAGNLGIGLGNPGFRLEVNGPAHRVDNSANWTVVSDRRFKRDITTLTNSLEVLERLRPVSFRYNEDYVREHPGMPDQPRAGFVAQEFADVFPDYVTRTPDGYLSLDVSPVTFHNTAAIQELNQKLEQKETEITELEARLEKLERLLAAQLKGAAK